MGIAATIDAVVDRLCDVISPKPSAKPELPQCPELAELVGRKAVIVDNAYVPKVGDKFSFAGVLIPLIGIDSRARYGVANRTGPTSVLYFNIYPERIRSIRTGEVVTIDLEWPYGGGCANKFRPGDYAKIDALLRTA